VLDPEKRATSAECLGGCLEAEGCDRPGTAWPAGQRWLIEQAASWGLPVVLVVVSGGSLDLADIAADVRVPAVLWAAYPGQAGAEALSAILFGAASPSGRLPITLVASDYTARLPMASMAMRPSADGTRPGRTHRFLAPTEAVFPFGHGLSFDQWTLQWADVAPTPHTARSGDGRKVVEASEPPPPSTCDASLTITLGAPATRGAFTVLVFLRPPAAAGPRAPQHELRRFTRVAVEASEDGSNRTAFVPLTLRASDFALADAGGSWRLVAGNWTLEVSEPVALRRRATVGSDGSCWLFAA